MNKETRIDKRGTTGPKTKAMEQKSRNGEVAKKQQPENLKLKTMLTYILQSNFDKLKARGLVALLFLYAEIPGTSMLGFLERWGAQSFKLIM